MAEVLPRYVERIGWAVVALADGDFPLALRLWREIRQRRETRPG